MKKAVLCSVLFAALSCAQGKKIGDWTGSGVQQTKAFDVTKRHVSIFWATKAVHEGVSVFQLYVHRDSDDKLVEVAVNAAKDGEGENLVRLPAGKYYFKINSANKWSIAAYEE